MADTPSPVPTPAPPVPEPTPVPQVVTRKHRITIISAIIVVVVLVLVISGSVVFVLWRSNQPVTTPTPLATLPAGTPGQLPGAASQTPAVTIPDRSAELAQNQNNLVVTVQYTSKPQFKLSVSNVERTYQADADDLYAPITGSPYSILKVYDATNKVLLERQFAVTTSIIAEGEGQVGGQTNVDSSQAVLNLAMPANATPTKVELVSSSGQLFDTRTFTFDELPIVFDVKLSVTPTPNVTGL